MSAQHYEELLHEFQTAYVRYGRNICHLIAYTQTDRRLSKRVKNGIVEELAHIAWPLDSAMETMVEFWVFGHSDAGVQREMIDHFKELAAKGGAFLPVSIRDTIRAGFVPWLYGEPVNPVEWWIALLFHKPEMDDDGLADIENITEGHLILWYNMFLASADAIQRCRLNTDEPIFSLPVHAEPKPAQPIKAIAKGTAGRAAYKRDHLWLMWRDKDGLGDAEIRDKWNEMSDSERLAICPQLSGKISRSSGRAVVYEGIKKAKAELFRSRDAQ